MDNKEFYSLEEIDIKEFDLIDSSFKLDQFIGNIYFDSNSSFNLVVSPSDVQYLSPKTNDSNMSSEIIYKPELNLDTNEEEEDEAENDPKKAKNKKRRRLNLSDKPPEPYADIIIKAIISSNEQALQLKDIYNYMSQNYSYFTSKVETSRWKSAIRHNLSSQKFFIKTCEKNAQGHYWTIESNYLKLIKEKGINNSIKKSFNKKLKSKKTKTTDDMLLNDSILTSNLNQKSSESVNNLNNNNNQTYFNDSAFFSSNDNENSQTSFGSNCSYKFLNSASSSSSTTSTYQTYEAANYYYNLNQENFFTYDNLGY